MNTSAATIETPAQRDVHGIARSVIIERITKARKSLCMVVGLVDAAGTSIVAHGRFSHTDPRTPDEHTVFELGSIIKVFDALLLNEMAERGEVGLMDPVEHYLPPDVKIPRRGQPITFQHLVTHMSGLPGRTNPAAGRAIATTEELLAFLSTYTLTRDPGTYYEYSNAGAALLRYVLALRAGEDYESLLLSRIFKPLHMESTVVTPTPELSRRTAVGHDDRLEAAPVNPLEMRSTAHDLGIFLRACMGLDGIDSSLARAMKGVLSVRIPCGSRVETAMGWKIETHGADEIICHDGVTWGCRAWIGYRPGTRQGAVILSNAATVGSILDIGYHLLDESYPLLPPESQFFQPPAAPNAITLSAEVLKKYVGRYQLTPNVIITITQEGDQLFAQKSGYKKVAIYPETPFDFFCKDVDFFVLPADTRISFQANTHGEIAGIALHQRGHDIWLPRTLSEGADIWFGHVPVTVDPLLLRKYAGRYLLGDTKITILWEAEGLIAEFNDDLRVKLVPESETRFFIKNDVRDMVVEFETDNSGRVLKLTGTFDGQKKNGVPVEQS